jgi:opacity protein-like surface antigen
MNFNRISSVLFFLLVVFGQALSSSESPLSARFYLGPSVGISQVLGRQNLLYRNNNTGSYGFKSPGHHTAGFWGVRGGSYLFLNEKNFIDFDLYYLNQNNQVNFTKDTNGFIYVSLWLKKRYSYGAGLSVGRRLYEAPMPLLAYLRAGVENSQIRLTQAYSGTEFTGQSFTQKRLLKSATLGLGLKVDINENLFCNLGYTYVFPKDMKMTVPYRSNGGGDYSYKFTCNEQRFELSLGWKF